MPRTHRLSKRRTFDSTCSKLSSFANIDDHDLPILESPTTRHMPLKGFSTMEVGNNPGAKTSSSTVDSVGSKPLSTGPDPQNNVLDVEQAINLLQELKKTASPEDLVALHRALLPTKDIFPSPRQESAEFPSPKWQRRSAAIPPGLATRAGVGLDLLQKPSDCNELNKIKARQKNGSHQPAAAAVPDSSITALNLANDESADVPDRVLSPTDLDYPQTGIYRHGTLRVTNGAASPDPSTRGASRGGGIADDDQYEQPTLSEYFPALEQQLDSPCEPRARMPAVGTKPSVDSMKTHDGSPTAQQQNHLQTWQESAPTVSPHKPSRPSAPARAQTDPATMRGEEVANPIPFPETATLARFQQRHCRSTSASEISADYISQCQISASPYEEHSIIRIAARLSTVFDSMNYGNECTHGTPADALAMLTGQGNEVDSPRGAAYDTSSQQSQSSSILQLNPRPCPQKTDSGYASDASFRNPKHQTAQDHALCNASPAAEDGFGGVQGLDGCAGKGSFDGTRSLYTFEEALESSTMLGKEASPKARRSKSKKSLPLLKLHSLMPEKRNSLQPASVAVKNGNSPQSQASLAKQSEQTNRLQKKLKKPMPDALKKQRSDERTITKDTEHSLELSTVPEDSAVTHVRRVRDEVIGDTDLCEGSVDQPPAEANAESPDSRWSLFSRSKSRSRDRSNSVRQSTVELPGPPEAQRPWSIHRNRSKSEGRTRSLSAMRSSVGDMINSHGSAPAEGRSIEVDIPACTNSGSVDRTLGGGTYDTPANMVKRATVPVPGTTQPSVQSPLATSTRSLKTKSRGMTPEMASELARKKSRDFAPQDTQHTQDRPKIAMSKHLRPKSRSSAAPVLERRVEDYFPEWQSKPVASHPAPAPGANKPYSSYAESVPPLPELPLDVIKKAHRADEIIAKKSSARSTPNASARNSADMSQARLSTGKKSRSSSRVRFQRELTTTIDPSTPSRQIVSEQSEDADYALRTPTHNEADTRHASAEKLAAGGQASPASRDSMPAGCPGWEQQAILWRQYQRSLRQQLDEDEDKDEYLPQPELPPPFRKPAMVPPSKSPSIVVSRYITPLAAESAARSNAGPPPPSHAAQHAEAYRGLIGDDKENRPAQDDIPRTDSAVSSASSNATFVTVKSWDPSSVKQSVPRSDSSVSANTTTTVTTTTTFSAHPKTSPAQRSRAAGGPFVPYSPTQAAAAERSRTERLAAPDISSPSADAASLAWLDVSANSSTTSLGTPCGPRQPKKTEGSLHDRYSGGLGYDWDRVSGFGGSAGTRTSGCEGNRKSVHMSEEFGIDLSDVPVFLQKRFDR
ncbi:hypothetical protein EJ03DRAFT_15062 [Teratosphaeria nubilosa]|uniref:Uncharacterized protein n=1 Tax=Teratosphaeria nubilosa TaxID=161662 RepID=A0A6G1KVZ4_9PEZI|nr:hypothetical protein EJ03DRAFT_15062 [Teratosphaeria nubilosa]